MRAYAKLAGRKPNCDFALRTFGRVAAVHEVTSDRLREIRADCSRRSFARIGCTDRLTARFDRTLAGDDHGYDRRRGDVRDQALEERLAVVFGIVFLREL